MNREYTPVGDSRWARITRLWQENQGWYLIAFTLLIFAIGTGILFYRQLHQSTPGFPEGRSRLELPLIDVSRETQTQPPLQ